MGLSDLFKKKNNDPIGDDSILSQLDELKSAGEYEKIIQKTEEVPADNRSNELWFRRIEALIKVSRFNDAKKEISLLSKRCSKPEEDARLYYSLGLVFDNTDSELKAAECFLRAQEFYPEFEGIQDAIDDSIKRAGQKLSDAKSTFEKLFADISDAIKNSEDKKKIDENDAFSYISMIQASFLSSMLNMQIPLGELFFKCNDADKPKMKSFLKEKYGIVDLGSLQQWFGGNQISPELDIIISAVEKNANITMDNASAAEKMHIKASTMVIKEFKDLIPKSGLIAWDYCTILALTRMAFSCDLLSNMEYLQTCLFFTDACKGRYSSWEEFSRAVVIGGFYNTMCLDTQYDIKAATLFGNVAASHCKNNYPKVTWIG